jgi:hypothetical protein
VKKALPFVLILAGAGVMVFGGYRALSALAGLYEANLSDPLNQPEGSEQAVSRKMLHGVMIGGAGAPFFLAGYVMWKTAAARARRPKP